MAENYEFYTLNSNIQKKAKSSVARFLKSLQTPNSACNDTTHPQVCGGQRDALEDCLKMFHVVEFSDSSEVEVVPSSWVQNETCVWPPYKLTKFRKAVTTQECPAPTWTTFRVRILHTTETHQAARQKLQEATLMSDLQRDDVDDLPSYEERKNRGNKRCNSSESEEEDVVVGKRLDKRRSEALAEFIAAPSPPVTMAEALRSPCGRPDDAITTPSTSRNSFSPSTSEVGDGDRVVDQVLSVLAEVLKEQKVIKQQLSTFQRNQQTQSRSSSRREELPDQAASVLPLSDLSNLPKRAGSGW